MAPALLEHEYYDREIRLKGHIVRPDGPPRAAVAVYPTIHNLTPRVAQKAQALADEGYLVLVADFYGEEITDANPGPPLAEILRADVDAYRRRLRACIDSLSAQAGDLPLFAIGFCMGGQAVLELARDGADLAAVASFHGLLDTGRPALHGSVKPRILACHGDKDPMVPRSQVTTFMEEMDAAGADWHLHIYSHARHGFTDPANDEKPIDAVAYDASADRQSWAAMLELFEEVLGP